MGTEFGERQERRSFAALREIRIEPQEDGGGILIKVRAFGAFAPLALDGLRVELELDRPDATPIVGLLKILSSDAPRGTWFDYAFIPLDYRSIAGIEFFGRLNWSDVASVVFRGREPLRIKNGFCGRPAS